MAATKPGFANMGVVLNAPYLGAWPTKIGSFILNFGGIELITYQQLMLLESSREDFVKNVDRLFGKRIDRLVELLAAAPKLQETERTAAIEQWERARELAVWRNRIAHNPALPTWKPGSNADVDPPDVLGVPDFKQFKDGTTSDSIPIELMGMLIDESAAIAQKLHEVSVRLQGDA
ncbi:hypothetical protein [Acidovorax sp.]|uniref:hypothetical protein n=1 Tax=Acidovorax sp. TaxID=1872122 RepID=UPI0027B8BF86|nr:hypothetical protein [Acidovorax sp.]